MATEIVLVKTKFNSLEPATGHDIDLLRKWQNGSGVKVKVTTVSDNRMIQHRKYWGGLLSLTLDYWQPDTGILSEQEKNIILGLGRYMDKQSGNTGIAEDFAKEYLEMVKAQRAIKYESPNTDLEALHVWIKDQLGRYKIKSTPAGVIKEYESISPAKMSNENFELFYKQAFGVCWNFVLQQHFKNHEEMENTVLEMMRLTN